MKSILKYAVMGFGLLLLCRISPLGAATVVVMCLIKCCFKSGVVRDVVALLIHDFIRWVLRGFNPQRIQTEPYRRARRQHEY